MDIGSTASEELRMFIEEAQEQVQLLDEGIIRLEKEPDDVDLLNSIFRAAHTLKGSSSMIGFDTMAQLTHTMEDVLDRVRKHSLEVTPELVDALLGSLDGLKELCQNVNDPDAAAVDVTGLVADMTGLLDQGSGQKESASATDAAASFDLDPQAQDRIDEASAQGQVVYSVNARITSDDWAAVRSLQVVSALLGAGDVIKSDPSQEQIEQENARGDIQVLVATTWDEDALRNALSDIADVELTSLAPWQPGEAAAVPARTEALADVESVESIEAAEATGLPTTAAAVAAADKIDSPQTVRIDVATLDSLMNMVGELVIDRTRLAQISRAMSSAHKEEEMVDHLTTTTSHLIKVVDELNQEMMQARMLPVGMLFNKFPRMVRDLARSLGKDIDFVIAGAETEIDRSVIDKIKDPIVHMLRNGIDHGIEKPEERVAAGKPPGATLQLSAHQEQGNIYITIKDDGRGIDARRVKETAVKRGILTTEAAERLPDHEAVQLIFEAGFSTARETTEVSGRGVGMDVVQRSITELGGAISTETELGKGTTFMLRLPLTLATFPGLLVSAGGSAFAIPISFVQETLQLDEGATQKIMGSEVLNLRGQALPLLRLDAETLLGKDVGSSESPRFVVVLKSDNRFLGLVVENLLEQQEVVVKPIGALVTYVRGVAGASILGDGRVALILDITSLLRASSLASGGAVEQERIAV